MDIVLLLTAIKNDAKKKKLHILKNKKPDDKVNNDTNNINNPLLTYILKIKSNNKKLDDELKK